MTIDPTRHTPQWGVVLLGKIDSTFSRLRTRWLALLLQLMVACVFMTATLSVVPVPYGGSAFRAAGLVILPTDLMVILVSLFANFFGAGRQILGSGYQNGGTYEA